MITDGGTLIVATHADDELLWFQPLIATAKGILWAGPSLCDTRVKRMPEIYPESVLSQLFPTVTDQVWVNEANAQCYRDLETYSLDRTKARLRPALCRARRRHGVRRVMTHNPWGEYGHPNHRTLCQAVREVCVDIGMDAWTSAVVHTHLGNGLTSNPPGEYLDATYLNAEFETGYQFSRSEFLGARSMFQDTFIYATVNGQPWQSDLWTWPDSSTNEYPMGARGYWKMVADGVDLINTNATLLDQVNKIAGITAYPPGDPHIAYYSPLYYSCASSGDAPIFGVP